jgi:hypothetical protein
VRTTDGVNLSFHAHAHQYVSPPPPSPPSCSVFETNLGRNTFELVTAKKVLHVQTPTADELIDWMQAVREASNPYLIRSLSNPIPI